MALPKVAPLPASFLILAIFGFLFSSLYIAQYNLDWAFAFALVFVAMFIASFIAMERGSPDEQLMAIPILKINRKRK